MGDLDAVARVLGVAPDVVRWYLMALPAAPVADRRTVRLTVLVRERRGLRAHVIEADTEDAALVRLCRQGVLRG